MTKEEKFVVDPLGKYFLNYKRSGAKWIIKDRSRGRSETGWDLQVERKNQALLIEAKYIRWPFASALAGLIIAPLTNKTEKMKSGKKKSWSAVICWAIGFSNRKVGKHAMRNGYQILFNYIARNLKFWGYYAKTLKVKYFFFIDNRRVAKISFEKIIDLATRYKLVLNKSLPEKRARAEKLLRNLNFR